MDVTITHGDESIATTSEELQELADKLTSGEVLPAESADESSEHGEQPAEQLTPAASEAFIAKLIDLNNDVAAADSVVLDLKEQLKAAKEDYESAQRKLSLHIDSLGNDEDRPLLKALDAANAASAAEGSAPAANEAWRSAPLGELGLTAKLAEKLEEAGVETIGNLEDLRAAIAEHKAEWPKGIGPGKVTLIEDAQLDWLQANRDTWGVTETVEPDESA